MNTCIGGENPREIDFNSTECKIRIFRAKM